MSTVDNDTEMIRLPAVGSTVLLRVDQALLDAVRSWSEEPGDANGKWARQLKKLLKEHGPFLVPTRVTGLDTYYGQTVSQPDGSQLVAADTEVNYEVVSEALLERHGSILLEGEHVLGEALLGQLTQKLVSVGVPREHFLDQAAEAEHFLPVLKI